MQKKYKSILSIFITTTVIAATIGGFILTTRACSSSVKQAAASYQDTNIIFGFGDSAIPTNVDGVASFAINTDIYNSKDITINSSTGEII
jgi:hypothetical protein